MPDQIALDKFTAAIVALLFSATAALAQDRLIFLPKYSPDSVPRVHERPAWPRPTMVANQTRSFGAHPGFHPARE
jgi:hypothetical protein